MDKYPSNASRMSDSQLQEFIFVSRGGDLQRLFSCAAVAVIVIMLIVAAVALFAHIVGG